MIKEDVSLRIKYLRRVKHKLTQDELAKIMSKDRVYIARVESGKVNMTLDTLMEFCNAFQLSMSEFFAFELPKEDKTI